MRNMKNRVNIIILALSAAFCSLSAQEKQVVKDSISTTLNAAPSQPIEEKLSSSKEDYVRPLFEPENKFFSLSFGAGVNTLKYNVEIGNRTPMAGGSVNLDYNIFFGGINSKKKMGISFGLGASLYDSKTIIDSRYTSTDKIPVTYSDGSSKIQSSEFYTDFENWEERQSCIALEAPIGLLYRKYLKGNTSLLIGTGVKLSCPVRTSYRVKAGFRETSGYIKNSDLEINSDLSQHGYEKKYDRPRGTVDTKKIAAGVYLDINFVHKTANADFFWGVYGTLGLTDINNSDKKSLTNINDYCGVLSSNMVDVTKLNAVGVKLGVKIPCPRLKDEDGDGVYDKFDKCPGTPAIAEVDSCGCPLDTDKDSVPDYLDKCPNTPKGIIVDSCGCPIDTDKDGVPDYLDKCPDTPDSVIVDTNGCPVDTDKDGVPDYLDKCPDTPSEAKVDENGCPIDTDGDGVPDYIDKCPTVKGTVENNGCPNISKTAKAVFKRAMRGIQFESNKAIIKSSSYPILDKVVKVMKDNPTYKLHIAGHTDNVGKAEHNMKLSKDRAAAVVKYLTKKGIKSSRLRSTGYGGTKPVATNKTEKGKYLNRRVDFQVEF